MDWSPQAETRLRQLWAQPSLTVQQIAERLGTRKGSILGKVDRLGLPHRDGTPRVKASIRERVERLPEPEEVRPVPPRHPGLNDAHPMRRDMRERASILHLVDLKRAGYSPTMTELRIGSDERHTPIRVASQINRSFCGSPAALCGEV